MSWTEADFDQPVSEDMSLRTGEKARARIRIGPDAIEMSDETVLNLLNLTDRSIEASIGQGRIYLQIDKLGAGESVEIEMRQGSVSLLAPGGYDIEVGSGDAPVQITVFDGKARFFGGDADTPVAAGQELRVTGNYPAVTATTTRAAAANPTPRATPVDGGSAPAPPATVPPAAGNGGGTAADNPIAPANPISTAANPISTAANPISTAANPISTAANPTPAAANATSAAPARPSDDFMYFVAESNSDTAAPQSARYVSVETTGYDELDRYGHWETLPDAGPVWFPDSVPPDWAPYRFGHWDWIAPWGWTWVDDEPWGFAPFHYGRWIDLDGRWGWVPGPVDPDPVYAPALVAFVDTGDQGPDGPDVGWFPLAPGDAYVPWYAAGPAYVARVNAGVAAGSRVGEAWRAPYANRRYATVVTRGAFTDGRPVQRGLARVSEGRLAQASVLRGAPHVAPPARPAMRGEAAGERAPRPEENRRPELSRPELSRPELSRAGPGHGVMPQRERPVPSRGAGEAYRRGGQQFNRPEGFHNAASANRGGVQQFRQPEAFRTPTAFAGRGFQTPQFGGRSPTLFGGHAAASGLFGGHSAGTPHFGSGGFSGGHHK